LFDFSRKAVYADDSVIWKQGKGGSGFMDFLYILFFGIIFFVFYILPYIFIIVGIWRGDVRGGQLYLFGAFFVFGLLSAKLPDSVSPGFQAVLVFVSTWAAFRIFPAKGSYSRFILKLIFCKNSTRRKALYYRNTTQYIIRSSQSSKYPSCEKIVMEYVNAICCNSFSEFRDWPQKIEYEYYDRLISPGLYNVITDLLNGSTYRIFGNLTDEGKQLYTISLNCLEHSKEKSYITDEEYQEKLDYLKYLLSSDDFSII